jgi:hypothetical protein
MAALVKLKLALAILLSINLSSCSSVSPLIRLEEPILIYYVSLEIIIDLIMHVHM